MIIKLDLLLRGPSCLDRLANFHSAHTNHLDKTYEDEELIGRVGTSEGICHMDLLLYFPLGYLSQAKGCNDRSSFKGGPSWRGVLYK